MILSLSQAARKRGDQGKPLPNMYPKLKSRQADINQGQVTLIVGPPSAGKSLFTMNYMVRAEVPTLAFLLDSDYLTVASRFGAIKSGDPFATVKEQIEDYVTHLEGLSHIQTVFRGEELDDIKLQVQAFEQRYGRFPSMIVIDNLGNLTSNLGEEWAVLKALTLELDKLAKEWESAIVCTHHMTDITTCEPLQRDKILGKIAQYPRLIYSIGFNPSTNEYKIAIVKNSQGPSDPGAQDPVIMFAETERMGLYNEDPSWNPSKAANLRTWGAFAKA